jgi:hypothetical protein
VATWYAQATNTNINAANMWNSLPAGGGTVLPWPPAVGDVLVANGKTVTVNVSTIVTEVRNGTTGGATSGGVFRLAASVSLTANVYCEAGTECVSTISGTAYIVGNCYGGNGAGQRGAVTAGSGHALIITGNAYGGTGSDAHGIGVATSGTTSITLTGNAYGAGGDGVNAGTNATSVTITGGVYGSSTAGTRHGVRNQGTGTVTVTGNAEAGSTAAGASNTSTGTLTISGYAQASTTQPAVSNSAQGSVTVGETRSASNGLGAVTGAFRFASATAAKTMPYTPDGQISMTVLDVAAIVPAESDVRKGLVYGDGAYTGTLQLGRNRTSMTGRF